MQKIRTGKAIVTTKNLFIGKNTIIIQHIRIFRIVTRYLKKLKRRPETTKKPMFADIFILRIRNLVNHLHPIANNPINILNPVRNQKQIILIMTVLTSIGKHFLANIPALALLIQSTKNLVNLIQHNQRIRQGQVPKLLNPGMRQNQRSTLIFQQRMMKFHVIRIGLPESFQVHPGTTGKVLKHVKSLQVGIINIGRTIPAAASEISQYIRIQRKIGVNMAPCLLQLINNQSYTVIRLARTLLAGNK